MTLRRVIMSSFVSVCLFLGFFDDREPVGDADVGVVGTLFGGGRGKSTDVEDGLVETATVDQDL